MLNKILLTIIVIAVVWIGFKYWSRYIAGPGARPRMPKGGRPEPQPQPQQAAEDVQEMVQCRVCGSYVSAQAKRCGRPDCPL